ncbi:MAG: pyridoxamine 5'-phosphate oxidase family protein [Clostridiales bacterium]|nr:pyridoxamine 5'-phosphate oxidase family protein [Clostridiales bacterium]
MRQMRKSNRQKGPMWALEVFDKAPYVTVSMMRPDGTPYGLPLNVVRKDETTFYFHCAFEGEKVDCLRHSPVVSLSAVSRCTPKYEAEKNNFTEYYNSAVAVGKAEFVTDDAEKIEALRLLCKRFLPEFMEHFEAAIARSLDFTNIVRITLTDSSVGKSKP